MVLALIGIVAGWAFSRVDLTRYRVDSAVRMLQNVVIAAQQTAITRNAEVTLRFDRTTHTVETRVMIEGTENVRRRRLPSGTRFLIPAAGVDGAASDFVGGLGASEVPGVTFARDVHIAPNGSIRGGDVVVYLGLDPDRPTSYRAVEIIGATTRTAFWSLASGSWRRQSY